MAFDPSGVVMVIKINLSMSDFSENPIKETNRLLACIAQDLASGKDPNAVLIGRNKNVVGSIHLEREH